MLGFNLDLLDIDLHDELINLATGTTWFLLDMLQVARLDLLLLTVDVSDGLVLELTDMGPLHTHLLQGIHIPFLEPFDLHLGPILGPREHSLLLLLVGLYLGHHVRGLVKRLDAEFVFRHILSYLLVVLRNYIHLLFG